MKRALITLSLCLFAAATGLACSEDTSSLSGASGAEQDSDKTETETPSSSLPPSTKKSDNSGASSATPDSGTKTAPPATPTSCAATATKTDCAKCCGEQNDPTDSVKDCACNAGAKCQAACTANFCSDKLPDIACGLCLAQSDCKPSTDTTAAQACLQQCQDKP